MFYDEEYELICQRDYIDNEQSTPSDIIQLNDGSICSLNNVLNVNWSDHHPLIIKLEILCDHPDITSNTSQQKLGDFKINLSPNPASLSLSINSSEELSKSSYRIFSSNGQLLITGNLGLDSAIDISALIPGNYYLQLESAEYEFPLTAFIKG